MQLNSLFVTLLSNYQYNPALRKPLQSTLTQKLKERLALNEKDSTLIKKKLAEKKSLLEKLELEFIADQITEELYQKHATTLRQEIESTSFSSLKLENAVRKCLTIAQKLCQSWVTPNMKGNNKSKEWYSQMESCITSKKG
jgi:hypothetical protein